MNQSENYSLAIPEQLFVKLVILGVPVPKGRARLGKPIWSKKHNRMFTPVHTPKETRDYEEIIAQQARDIMKEYAPLEGALTVRISAYLPVPESYSTRKREQALSGLLKPLPRPDVDNYEKTALDALNGIIFPDDAQVCDLIGIKRYSDNPRLEIEVFI